MPEPPTGKGVGGDGRIPLRVLLVEDDPVNRVTILGLLEHLGFGAETVGNGREALDLLDRESFDLVLMDLEMPVMGGLEATRRLRARRPAREGPRIVACTSRTSERDRRACREAGMDGFLAKPVRMEDLRAVLEGRAIPPSPEAREHPPRSAEPPLLERSILDGLLRIDEDGEGLLVEMIDLYAEHGARYLAEAAAAVERGDLDAGGRAAHGFKGGSLNVGARRAGELARRLEEILEARDAAAARDLLPRIEASYRESLEALRREAGGA